MQKITAAITAVGGFVPEDRLTNADLEKMVDTTDEWIRTRTGVVERRILKGENKGSSDLGAPDHRVLVVHRADLDDAHRTRCQGARLGGEHVTGVQGSRQIPRA